MCKEKRERARDLVSALYHCQPFPHNGFYCIRCSLGILHETWKPDAAFGSAWLCFWCEHPIDPLPLFEKPNTVPRRVEGEWLGPAEFFRYSCHQEEHVQESVHFFWTELWFQGWAKVFCCPLFPFSSHTHSRSDKPKQNPPIPSDVIGQCIKPKSPPCF